ncbi:MAG: hypothetical protein CSA65_07785 [Proteobacteria bacterium]|nr:MAG: hypothetical protein CSA65_07785 [Pseudomonadota bacterium]
MQHRILTFRAPPQRPPVAGHSPAGRFRGLRKLAVPFTLVTAMAGAAGRSSAAPGASAGVPKALRVDRAVSLGEAMRLAATRNLGLLRGALERDRVKLGYDAAWATFLPELTLNASYANLPPFVVDASSTASTAANQRLAYGANVSWTSPVGTSLSVGMNTNPHRLTGAASNSSSLSLTATQPLLKGGWKAGAANGLAEAALDVGIQRALFRQQLEALLAQVQNAYWALAFAELDVKNRKKTRDRANQQYLDTKENIRRGIIAKIEIFVVEDNLVFFEQQLMTARQRLALARRALAQLLQVAGDSKLSCSDALGELPAKLPTSATVVAAGLRGNPRLRAEHLRLRKNRVQLAFQKNQALPSLDLTASFRLNGLDEQYGRHLSQVFSADRPEATVGLVLTIPLSWRANRAKVSQAKLGLQRQLLALKRQEALVRYQVGDALTNLGFQVRRLRLAERRLALSKKKLGAEVEKYKNGISTLDVIVRFQRELDQAVLGVRRAQLSLRQSWASLSQLLGSQHRRFGIRLGGTSEGARR